MSTTTTARAQQGAAAKASLRDRLAGKKPLTSTYQLVLDPEVWGEVEAARDALAREELFEDAGKVKAARERVAKAEEHAETVGAVETLTLRAVARPVYEALLLAHPPTEAQKTDGQTYDVDTFSPALVAACVVDEQGGNPLSPDEVRELWDGWNQGEVFALWSAVLTVCTQARNPSVPFGSGRTRG